MVNGLNKFLFGGQEERTTVNAPDEKRSFNDWINPIMGTLNFSNGNSYSESKSLKLSTTFRCVALLSDSIASLPFLPYTYKNKNGENWKYVNYDNNIYNLLNVEPNPFMDAYILKKMIVMQLLLKGNSFIVIDRTPQGIIIGLKLLQPEYVSMIVEKSDVKYIDNLTGLVYDKSMIIHLKNYPTYNQTYGAIWGVSTIAYAANVLGLAYNAEEHASNFYSGGGNLAGILRPTSGNLVKGQAESAKSKFMNALDSNLGGKSGSVVVLDSGFEYQSITVNPKDSQLLESRAFSIAQICAFFGVPPSLAFSEGQKFSTAEQQSLDFLMNGLTPLMEKIENEMFRKLFLPSEWSTSELKFDSDNLLRTDMATRAEAYSKLINCGAMTVNEAREKMNANSPQKNGNRSLIPVNLQFLDEPIVAINQIDNQVK